MTWTVVWRPLPKGRLATIWIDAEDRQAVTDAADEIDALLKTQASEVGESRGQLSRILTVAPLSVFYDVYEDDRLVSIWAVWRTRNRSS